MRARAAAAALAATFTLSGCAVGLQDLPVGSPGGGIDVTAELDSVDGVVVGADVRAGQKAIGRVSKIELDGATAVLTLALDETAGLPENVTAQVQLPSALGTPFIRLDAPAEPVGDLVDGTRIRVSQTSMGPQVEDTLAALGNLVSGSGMKQLQSIMTSLNSAFAERSDKVGDLIDTLNRLLARSSAHTRDFNAAMKAAADVTDTLVAHQDTISAFLDQTPRAVSVLAAQRDAIASLMSQTSTLAGNLDRITRGRVPELSRLVPDASKLVAALGTFNDDVGQTLTHMNGFMTNMGTAIRGDYLVFDGALDIPGGIDKILTGGLLASGQPLPTPGELSDVLTGRMPRDKKGSKR
ncbi:hypothetical protein nbrc107696_13450 [Gordonia spumicola]|uniref:Mce family protein n=1 Tax=Gordonia spumicola TaxID=589161 RepID=A0A7I9V639_9ACTN|nr:MCE family protein [Gordonia spumicola]GEE00899.1 hypothetical protein nbrc107696_13450 [Gordonia spumicola]